MVLKGGECEVAVWDGLGLVRNLDYNLSSKPHKGVVIKLFQTNGSPFTLFLEQTREGQIVNNEIKWFIYISSLLKIIIWENEYSKVRLYT